MRKQTLLKQARSKFLNQVDSAHISYEKKGDIMELTRSLKTIHMEYYSRTRAIEAWEAKKKEIMEGL